MAFEQITTELSERVLTVTLNRPERLNAWTATMAERADRGVRPRRRRRRGPRGHRHRRRPRVLRGRRPRRRRRDLRLPGTREHRRRCRATTAAGRSARVRLHQARDRRHQRTGGRHRRDDDAAHGHPPRGGGRPHGLRVHPPRDRPRGLLQLVPATRRRHQPRDGVGEHRARVLRAGGTRGRAPAQPAPGRQSCSTRARLAREIVENTAPVSVALARR